MPTLIIGAGLTGLAAGYRLRKSGIPFEILEKSDAPGGASASVCQHGIWFDMGVHIFYFRREQTRQLFREMLGEDFIRQEKRVKIAVKGTYVDYPYQANLHQLPAETRIASLAALFRAQQTAGSPANFKEWLIATFGERIAEDFLIPHNQKLMQVPLEKVSLQWPERFFPLPNVEEIISGAFQKSEKQFHPNQHFWYPREGGAGALGAALSQGQPIRFGTDVSRIDWKSRKVELAGGEVKSYQQLVTTMPLPELLRRLEPTPPWADEIARRLQYSSISVVMLGFKNRSGLSRNGLHWIYYPDPAIAFQRLSFTENYSGQNAPQEYSGICLECTSPGREAPPSDLVDRCLADLQQLGICDATDLVSSNVHYFKYGYPLFHHEYDRDLQTVREFLENHHIRSSGRFGAWRYSNMEDALMWGFEAAEWVQERNSTCAEKKLSLSSV